MSVWWGLALAGVGCFATAAECRLRAARNSARAQVFDECSALLTDATLAGGRAAYPTLRGSHHGLPIKLEALVDTLAWRKLPALWLKIDILQALPVAGTLDYLLRPLNHEFWSPANDLPHDLPVPSDWPAHASLRTNQLAMAEVLGRLDPYRDAFGDERFKELLITPRGLRVVYLAGQGARLHYGVLRRAEFDDLPVPAETLAIPLQLACALHCALSIVR